MMKVRVNGKKLILIGLLAAFMCTAAACTRNKDNNNDPSDMAGNQTMGDSDDINAGNNGSAADGSTDGSTVGDDGSGVGGAIDDVADDAGNTVGGIVDDVTGGVNDLIDDMTGVVSGHVTGAH